jgi:hypothetical protein
MGVSMQHFSVISELLNGDSASIRRVLRAFRNEMEEGIRLLGDAMLREDWELANVVVLRAAAACHLLSEIRAGIRLETLANASARSTEASVLARYCQCARDLLMDLMARASACMDEMPCISASESAQARNVIEAGY